VRELAVQSANASNSAGDRKALQAEVGQLLSELNRIANTTEFNGQKLLDGSFGAAQFQVGANANQTITATTGDFRTTKYGSYRAYGEGIAAAATPAYTAGNLVINGIEQGTIAATADDTARTLTSKINSKAEVTGVTASARTVAELGGFEEDKTYSLALNGDNTDTDKAANVTFSVSTLDANGLSEAISAINAASSKTGITARLNEGEDGIILTNESGEDIVVKNNSETGNDLTLGNILPEAAFDNDDSTAAFATGENLAAGDSLAARGYIELNSDRGFSLTDASGAFDTAASSTLNTVAEVDISTVSGSTDALKVLDSALAAINNQRAQFGALQSRFETTIANLQVSSENMAASRSRIRDTDFAQETANLTRAQILQQAGTAMLSQANALPQNVLSLLG
jgi:flagellin